MGGVGVVVIGRNEGERLVAALESVRDADAPVLYVDSASRDGSPERARTLGVTVLELAAEAPLTAARGRNAGFAAMRAAHPELAYVQFVDGDSRIEDGWVVGAAAFLDEHPETALVAGAVREVDREASVYNRLCDLEWNGPSGEVESVGGIFMVRAEVFDAVGGFDAEVIAGEEAELCERIRGAGHTVRRLPEEMARHDAAMTRFSQWFKRAVRSGHAYGEAAARGNARASRQVRSFLLWGGLVPMVVLVCLGLTPFWPRAALFVLPVALGYGMLGFRIARGMKHSGHTGADARTYAFFCVLAKFPQTLGYLTYRTNRLLRRRTPLIEHKQPEGGASG